MAFNIDSLVPVATDQVKFWDYTTTDSRSTVAGTGYFARADVNGMNRGDIIYVTNSSSGDTYKVEITGIETSGKATGAVMERVNTAAITSATITTATVTTLTADTITGTAATLPITGLAAAQGGSATVKGGASSTSANAGGAAVVQGGLGGATGVGGAATVVGAAGGATSGAGGVASVTGGAGTAGNSTGGIGKVVGGAGQGTAAGGKAQVTGGASGAGATGNGGAVELTGGAAGSTDGNGGSVVLAGGALAGTGVAGMIIERSVKLVRQAAPATATDTATLTAAQLLSGIVLSTPTAAAAYTMPLATDVDTAIPDSAANDAFDFTVVNLATNGAFDITMTTNTGWTITGGGNMVVESNDADRAQSSARFRARKTGTGAWSLYRIA